MLLLELDKKVYALFDLFFGPCHGHSLIKVLETSLQEYGLFPTLTSESGLNDCGGHENSSEKKQG
jgi:hypothetical protein